MPRAKTPLCAESNQPFAALSVEDRQLYSLADDFVWICPSCHLASNGTKSVPAIKHLFDPNCECANCLRKRGKTFQYVNLIPNLPDGSAGIYTVGETPDDAMRKHLHELHLIGLGEGKGRAELEAKADAILRAADTPKKAKGGKPPAGRSKRIPRAEAEIRVREWLFVHAKDNPLGIRRDALAKDTGVSTGQVSNTAAWKSFRERRDAETKPGVREVPLTAAMQAVMPSDSEKPDELAALIEEQRKDKAEQERRHGPS
jgi:hypothetical protein